MLISIMPLCSVDAAGNDSMKMDSVEISLITCTPHEEIYSLYGHTALRYRNLRNGDDFVFNYGVFNFNAPHFVARFVLGKTDYELGIAPLAPFCRYYKDWGSKVTEQVLNLTDDEKARVVLALMINARPENKTYRYNFFYDNCSTRPRDIIANNVSGVIVYAPHEGEAPTYREMLHELTGHHPWATMGNDLLLGLKADLSTTTREQQFLPMNLMADFSKAQIYTNGSYRPLVKEERILVEPGIQTVEEDFPLSPTLCFLLLAAIAVTIAIVEYKRHRCLVWFDTLLMLLTGIAGCLLFVMLFSEHPTTSTNLQILLLNPISLAFIPSVLLHKRTIYWKILLTCLILFFAGWFIQDYAEGMEILACCLLTRFISHKRNDE